MSDRNLGDVQGRATLGTIAFSWGQSAGEGAMKWMLECGGAVYLDNKGANISLSYFRFGREDCHFALLCARKSAGLMRSTLRAACPADHFVRLIHQNVDCVYKEV